MTGKALSGLRDKLYWRYVEDDAQYHCFKRTDERRGGQIVLIALCHRFERVRSGGGSCRRPEPVFRCALCDGREMKRRGWDESGPTLEPLVRSLVCDCGDRPKRVRFPRPSPPEGAP